MADLFVRHEVADFDTWKKGYDNASDMQQANGVKAEAVYRHEDDPNVVTVWHKFDSVAAAQEFMKLPELKEAMDEIGVKGKPEIWIANKV